MAQASVFLKAPQMIPMAAMSGNHCAIEPNTETGTVRKTSWLNEGTSWNTKEWFFWSLKSEFPFPEKWTEAIFEYTLLERSVKNPPEYSYIWYRWCTVHVNTMDEAVPCISHHRPLWSIILNQDGTLLMGNVIQGLTDGKGWKMSKTRDYVKATHL